MTIEAPAIFQEIAAVALCFVVAAGISAAAMLVLPWALGRFHDRPLWLVYLLPIVLVLVAALVAALIWRSVIGADSSAVLAGGPGAIATGAVAGLAIGSYVLVWPTIRDRMRGDW